MVFTPTLPGTMPLLTQQPFLNKPYPSQPSFNPNTGFKQLPPLIPPASFQPLAALPTPDSFKPAENPNNTLLSTLNNTPRYNNQPPASNLALPPYGAIASLNSGLSTTGANSGQALTSPYLFPTQSPALIKPSTQPLQRSTALPSFALPSGSAYQSGYKPPGQLSPSLGVNAMAPPTTSELLPTPAEETGKQVGALVTQLLEENPGLQEKIDHIDVNTLANDIGPKLEGFRVSIQDALKYIPQFVDRKIIKLFDGPKNQELATQFMSWLRKPADPEFLAAKAEQPEALSSKRASAKLPADLDAELISDEPLPDEKPKRSLFNKIVRPFGKDEKTEAKPAAKSSRAHAVPRSEELGKADDSGDIGDINDEQLEALLRRSALRRQRQEEGLV